MPKVDPPHNTVKVLKTEEKGSDVNLSVHVLNDAWKDKYDCAVIVTNDSDMSEALRLVKRQFPGKKLILIAPGNRPVAGLKRWADKRLILKKCILPMPSFQTLCLEKTKAISINRLVGDPCQTGTDW